MTGTEVCHSTPPGVDPAALVMSSREALHLGSLWLAILAGVVAPIARACGAPESVVSDCPLATLAVLIPAGQCGRKNGAPA